MISLNIKWFLGLSVAVHAAALVAWLPTEHKVGHSGQTLLLAVRNHTGEAVQQSQIPAETHTQPSTDNIPPQPPVDPSPVVTAAPVKQQPVKHPIVRQRADPSVPVQDSTPRPAQIAQTASSSISPKELDQHLRACVMDLITRQLSYPAIARRKGWQGVVRLELHIEPDGRISDLHIDQTSGYAVLDKAALQSLQLANIPDAVQWLDGETVDIVVPVEYRLVDG
ncbi:MAG: energy transducer TonB [Gammaproteobacteria bacterium]|nr:energy transducer TonB [Gammaproteobacteria bacterium]